MTAHMHKPGRSICCLISPHKLGELTKTETPLSAGLEPKFSGSLWLDCLAESTNQEGPLFSTFQVTCNGSHGFSTARPGEQHDQQYEHQQADAAIGSSALIGRVCHRENLMKLPLVHVLSSGLQDSSAGEQRRNMFQGKNHLPQWAESGPSHVWWKGQFKQGTSFAKRRPDNLHIASLDCLVDSAEASMYSEIRNDMEPC